MDGAAPFPGTHRPKYQLDFSKAAGWTGTRCTPRSPDKKKLKTPESPIIRRLKKTPGSSNNSPGTRNTSIAIGTRTQILSTLTWLSAFTKWTTFVQTWVHSSHNQTQTQTKHTCCKFSIFNNQSHFSSTSEALTSFKILVKLHLGLVWREIHVTN